MRVSGYMVDHSLDDQTWSEANRRIVQFMADFKDYDLTEAIEWNLDQGGNDPSNRKRFLSSIEVLCGLLPVGQNPLSTTEEEVVVVSPFLRITSTSKNYDFGKSHCWTTESTEWVYTTACPVRGCELFGVSFDVEGLDPNHQEIRGWCQSCDFKWNLDDDDGSTDGSEYEECYGCGTIRDCEEIGDGPECIECERHVCGTSCAIEMHNLGSRKCKKCRD